MLGIILNTPQQNQDFSSKNVDIQKAAEHVAKITAEANKKK